MTDKYLPPALRDFHDQKEEFKQMYKYYEGWLDSLPPHMCEQLRALSWIDLHVLTVDFALWHLAKQGFTLRANNKFMEEQ